MRSASIHNSIEKDRDEFGSVKSRVLYPERSNKERGNLLSEYLCSLLFVLRTDTPKLMYIFSSLVARFQLWSL